MSLLVHTFRAVGLAVGRILMAHKMPSRSPIVRPGKCFCYIDYASYVFEVAGDVCHMRRECEPSTWPENAVNRLAIQP